MNLLLKEQFIIRGGDRLDTTSWRLSWLAGVALPLSVPGAASAPPPTSPLEIELKHNFVNLRNPACFPIIFFFFSLSLFILSVCFFTHTRRYILFRCLFQFCLYTGTVVFTRLCGVFRRLLSLSREEYCVLRSRLTRMFIYLFYFVVSGLEISLATHNLNPNSNSHFQPRSVQIYVKIVNTTLSGMSFT
jgi:hypothetical protein